MNYKTLIAFLGKNQMKDWATPKSKWIFISQLPEGSDWHTWTKEFLEEAKANGEGFSKPYDSPDIESAQFSPRRRIQIDTDDKVFRCGEGGTFSPDEDFEAAGVVWHYNPSRGILLFSINDANIKDVNNMLEKADRIEWEDGKIVDIDEL
jgi:hypothetical protein